MLYKRFCKTLVDRGVLIRIDQDPYEGCDDDVDYYISWCNYNEKQYNDFKVSGTVSGIKDVTIDSLIWDFDNEADIERAKEDTVALCSRLFNYGIDKKDISIYFSGKKGFGVKVKTDKNMTVQEAKNICFALADGLEFDTKIYNSNRVIRLPATKHADTGLYKIPLSYGDLCSLEMNEIYIKAQGTEWIDWSEFNTDVIAISDEIYKLRGKIAKKEEHQVRVSNIRDVSQIDWKIKPKWLSNCKFALQNGFFESGMRSHALTALCATYKNQGFDEQMTYRMLKGVAQLQADKNKCERFDDSEIYNNIICTVYGPTWQGGQYSCKEGSGHEWLTEYCAGLGDHKCKHEEDNGLQPQRLTDIHSAFKNFVSNIEQNRIVIGIKELDEMLYLTTGSNTMILGAPSSGKTSLALDILENTNKMGIDSVFGSFDMARNRMFEKVCYRVTGWDRERVYAAFRENKEAELMEKISERFGNVNFMAKGCPTVADLRQYIINCQEKNGRKIKLVMVDYFERLVSDVGDDVASSKKIAGELQDIVNDLDVCLITIVQPKKDSLDQGVDEPLRNYSAIKGSGFLYQSARQIVSLWRPLFSLETFDRDKYMTIAVLKNDLGTISEFTYNWDGKRGTISPMSDKDKTQFEQWMKEKQAAKEARYKNLHNGKKW